MKTPFFVFAGLLIFLFKVDSISLPVAEDIEEDQELPSLSNGTTTDEGTQGNPGIKVTVTANGLNYIKQYGQRKFSEGFQRISIPNFERELPRRPFVCKRLDYKCEIRVWGTSITRVDVPSFHLLMQGPNQVGFTTSGGSIHMSGSWRKEDWARRRKLNTGVWPWKWENHEYVYARYPIGHVGSYTASANNFNIRMTGILQRNSKGLPEMTSVQVSVSVDSMDFNFNAGQRSFAGWLANQGKSDLIGHIKPHFESQARSMVSGMMQPLINQINDKLKQAEAINQELNLPEFELDYRLLQDPTVGADFIETKLVGELKHSSNQPTPFYPPDMHRSNDTSRMVYIQASDYLLNSFFYQAFMANMTKIEFRNMIIEPLAPPKVQFGDGHAVVEGLMHLNLSSPQLDADMNIKARLVDIELREEDGQTVLHTDVEMESLTLESVKSEHKDQSAFLPFLVDFLKPGIEMYVNQQLDKGVPLMVSVGKYLKDPSFRFLNRTLEISGDIIL